MRLTNTIREDIIKQLVTKRFAERQTSLDSEYHDFAEKVYDDAFTTQEHKWMKEIPYSWLEWRRYVNIEYLGRTKSLHFNAKNEKPFPRQYYSVQITPTYSKIFQDLERKKDLLDHNIRSARQQIMAVMNTVTTAKRLAEVWPEVKPFLPKDENQVITTALAIPMEQLNELLGLS